MTTIAFDGKTLATDKGIWFGDAYVWNRTTKLYELPVVPDVQRYLGISKPENMARSMVYAGAGNAGIVISIAQWLAGDNKPEIEKKDTCYGMLLDIATKNVYLIGGYLKAEHIEDFPVATGGGSEVALGAMLAGADAVRAVEIVAMRTNLSAGGVDFYTLE